MCVWVYITRHPLSMLIFLTIFGVTEKKWVEEWGGSERHYAEYNRGKDYILLSRLPGNARWSFWWRYAVGKVQVCEMKEVELQVYCWNCGVEERRWEFGLNFVFGGSIGTKFWYIGEGCVSRWSAMWILDTNSAFALESRKSAWDCGRIR
jgi:hypothetical protein